MDKIVMVKLGETERRMNVGRFVFNYYLEEYNKGKDNPGVTDYSIAIIYAGLMADCEVNNVTPDFTKEQVEKWVKLSDTDYIASVIEEYAKVTKKPGE